MILDFGVNVHGCFAVFVARKVLDRFGVCPCMEQIGDVGMPIPYNKDKTRNPSKIKGFRACPYSFSNKDTLRSRSKGGVKK